MNKKKGNINGKKRNKTAEKNNIAERWLLPDLPKYNL